MMSRQIITSNIGGLWYAEYTLPAMRSYARKVGADLLVLEEFPTRSQYGEAPHWIILEAIKHFALQDDYDHALMLDLDVVILPHCPDIFELAGDSIGVVPDMGIPDVDQPFRDWCQEWFDELPLDGSYFNAGMIVISRAAAKRLLSVLTSPYPDVVLPDNHYLNLKLPKRESITWLPHEFNWLAPQHADLTRHNIIHFVGSSKDMLPEFTATLT